MVLTRGYATVFLQLKASRPSLRYPSPILQQKGFSGNAIRASFATSIQRHKKADVTNESAEGNAQVSGAAAKRKPPRPSAGKISLRRVAVEAERSRWDVIRKSGKNRFVNPEVETRVRKIT